MWVVLQNNNNNQYYVSLSSGSYNNNNKNNKYSMVPFESEKLVQLVFTANDDCWSNKHASWDASKFYYHPGVKMEALIKSLQDGTYYPSVSICFVVMLPKPREIFAAHYIDRITHHIVAPYIIKVSEAAHRANGMMSFGNRKGYSSMHACQRVQQLMMECPEGIIASYDIKGFFMSSDKEVAWKVFLYYESKYMPEGYSEYERAFIRKLLHTMIMHDPSKNCERHSPVWMWERYVPNHKSLFYMNGFPLGNHYAQQMEGLQLAYICEKLKGYRIVDFVDDFAGVFKDKDEMHRCERDFDAVLSELHLSRNMKKVYRQPVRHGLISWCGGTIYTDRIYIDNRPLHNFERKLNTEFVDLTVENAVRLVATANSYFGSMAHISEWNNQKRFVEKMKSMGYGKYLIFKEKPNHVIVNLKYKYSQIGRSSSDLYEIKSLFNRKKHNKYDRNAYQKRLKAL